MKTANNLFEKVCDLDNLHLAFRKASRGKHGKQEVLLFEQHYDENISKLKHDLENGTCRVGDYNYFTIYEPKERLICAASFRERIIHHALMNVCHPYFDRPLIYNTHATRPGHGIYSALDSAVRSASQFRFIVKMDFRHYFDSVNHAILKEQLRHRFRDKSILSMFDAIIDSYCSNLVGYGLPIGNLTSQYFANTYLCSFDHYCCEKLSAQGYIRYMDDVFFAGNERGQLAAIAKEMKWYAEQKLDLFVKPPIIVPSKQGLTFLGYRVLPYRLVLTGRSRRRSKRKLKQIEGHLLNGEWDETTAQRYFIPLHAFVNHSVSRL